MTNQGHDQATAWFRDYLDGLGLQYEQDADLDVGKTPDFLVTTPSGERIVCEVKSFRPESGLWNDRPDTEATDARSQKEILKPIRGRIREAAVQLRAMEGLGLPLVIVLADPLRSLVPLGLTAAAMYGDASLVLTSSGDDETATWRAGRNGKLRNDHAYVSGVLVLEQRSRVLDDLRAGQSAGDLAELKRTDLGIYYSATLIESSGEAAVPVPEGIFAGEHDRRARLSPDLATLTFSSAREPE